jgi:hypothetical protein
MISSELWPGVTALGVEQLATSLGLLRASFASSPGSTPAMPWLRLRSPDVHGLDDVA